MAIAKVADRATVNSNSGVTTADFVLSSLTVGNLLIIRTSAENSGGSGAARTVTVTNQSGTAIDTATDQAFQHNNDPGAASAGVTCNVVVATITATSGTVRLTYSGTVVQAGVAEEWSGVNTVAPVVGSPVGASGTNSTNLASCADTSVASGNVAYCAMAVEGPSSDTYTADSDTSNGSWVTLTKAGTSNATATDNQTVNGGYKITTGTGAQTYNPTINNARDSAGIILELAAVVTVTATLAASCGGLTAAATAVPRHPATLATTAGGLSATASATPTHPATLAGVLGDLSASMTATVTGGAVTHQAVLDAPLGGLTGAATAVVTHPATLVGALGGLTAATTSTVRHPATGSGSCGELTAGAVATVTHPVVMSAALGGMVGALAATVKHAATGDAPLGALSGQFNAAVTHAAVIQTILGGLTASITASVTGGGVPPGFDPDPYRRSYALTAETEAEIVAAGSHHLSSSTTSRS